MFSRWDPRRIAQTTLIGNITAGVSSFFATTTNEQAYFKSQLDLCDDYGKALCHLARGMASAYCSECIGALADYNFAISLLNPQDFNHSLAVCVVYFNRGQTYLKQKDYAKAFDDFNFLGEYLPKGGYKSEFIFTENGSEWASCRTLALIGKYLGEDNFLAATEILLKSHHLSSEPPLSNYHYQMAVKMMFKKSFTETACLIFKSNSRLRDVLGRAAGYHDFTETEEEQQICKFFTTVIDKFNKSPHSIIELTNEDLSELKPATIDALVRGFENSGVNWPKKSFNDKIIPAKKSTRPKLGLLISQLPDDANIPSPKPLPENKPSSEKRFNA